MPAVSTTSSPGLQDGFEVNHVAAPELNDIEVVWHDLEAHHLAHQTFTDIDVLDREIHTVVAALNIERTIDSLVNWRISA